MDKEPRIDLNKKYFLIAFIVIIAIVAIMINTTAKKHTDVSKQHISANINTNKKSIARIDFLTPLVDVNQPQFEIYVNGNKTPEKQANWMHKFNRQGYVLESDIGIADVVIKAVKDAKINVIFKGLRDEQNKNLIKHWVEYIDVQLNNKPIIKNPTSVWYGKPFSYNINAKAGQIYTLNIKWQ